MDTKIQHGWAADGVYNTSKLDRMDNAAGIAKCETAIAKNEKREDYLQGQISKYEPKLKDEKAELQKIHDEGVKKYGKWDNWPDSLKTAYNAQNRKVAGLEKKIEGYENGIKELRADRSKLTDALTILKERKAEKEALKDALKSGDFQSALSMVLHNRTKNLDKMLESKIGEMQERNEKLTELNNKLAEIKGDKKMDKDTKAERITRLESEINTLNSDSQMAMIKLQSLTNKRNQAFEMLSNLMQKFSGTMDKLIGNIR